ncbi:MAG: hypothetical protein IKZ97_07275, partial [Butyrivibrio sp.]|nr:hypothetical protein [Butyrivibrio sp.]
VRDEMIRRGYKVNEELFLRHYRAFALRRYRDVGNAFVEVPSEHIFKDWHDERYLKQCFYNLQEKYDCGGISQAEWLKIDNYFKSKEITL